LTQVDPKMVIFVKYDYWFILLKALLERRVPIYFVSAVVKKGHFLMKWYSGPFRKILRQVNHFFVQDEFSAKQFDAMGIRQVTVVGDTRVDRVASLAQNVPAFPIIQEWVKGHRVFICGSTWANDEEIIVPAFRQLLDENWKIIIAPHDVSPKNVSRLRKILPASHEVFSSLSIDNQSDRTKLAPANILVVDTIGQLNMLYQYGTLCYIGGGFNKSGIHNTLEPATFGLPLIFGPNYSKFAEARALVKEGGAYSIGLWQRKKQVLSLAECRDQLEEVLRKMKEKESLEKARKVTKSYIEKNQGATTKILEKIYSAL
ncbi:MAG TPA: hypothetical protein ENK85_04160, partial [Saprospiraceae bacterium]|nr:hypothetical protein [Saprospiraceae bacterium]